MAATRVYVSTSLEEAVLRRLSAGCEARFWEGEWRCPEETLLGQVGEAEAVLGHNRWSAGMMDSAPSLRLIANIGVGYDKIDVAAATERGIIVTNTPGVLTDTTADLSFALLLATARRLNEAERSVRAGKWTTVGQPAPFLGRDVHHAILGIVGLGRIGQAMAKRGRGFDMTILYYDKVRRPDLEQACGYHFVDLDTLLRRSDFVSLHTDLRAETHHMIGAPQFARMKRTAILVNAGRGPLVDEIALAKALKEGMIAGAGLDVFEKEPPDPKNPLFELENVVVLPHIGSATARCRQDMVDPAVDNVLAFAAGQPTLTPVNPEAISSSSGTA